MQRGGSENLPITRLVNENLLLLATCLYCTTRGTRVNVLRQPRNIAWDDIGINSSGMIVYYQEEGRRVKREEIRRSSRSIQGKERERERERSLEIRRWKSGRSRLPRIKKDSRVLFIDPRRFLLSFLQPPPPPPSSLFASLEASSRFLYSLFPYERKGSRFSTAGDNKSGNKLFNTFHFGLVVR